MTFLLFSQVMRLFEQELTEQLLNRNFDPDINKKPFMVSLSV